MPAQPLSGRSVRAGSAFCACAARGPCFRRLLLATSRSTSRAIPSTLARRGARATRESSSLRRFAGCGHGRLGGVFLLCLPAGALPVLTGQGRMPAGAFRFAFRFFQPLARAPELFFRQAHTLAGHIGLELGTLDRLRRSFIPGRSTVCGGHFAAGFFHGSIREGHQSHTRRGPVPPHLPPRRAAPKERSTYPQNLCITMWTV